MTKVIYSIGIEFSTQSVKMVVLDLKKTEVAYKGFFEYDTTFPAYGTRGGVLPADVPEIRHTSPLMLMEALDSTFEKLSADGIDLSRVGTVKTDCMQHCSVYTNRSFEEAVAGLDARSNLVEQLGHCLARKTAPIWEDRSPVREVEYLTESLKSEGGIGQLTGNRAELRFPAAQILSWAGKSPEDYRRTTGIFLLSAFITSILAGRISAVDTGDGWGTNLNHLDIANPGWSTPVISTADSHLDDFGLPPSLASRIGSMDHYDAEVGTVNAYFTEKYGLDPETKILAGTGDNPATLLGCGGAMVVSLGSSYTVNGVMEEIVPSLEEEYNVFGFTKGKAMALAVFTNGGKVHDTFLKRYLNQPDDKKPGPNEWREYTAKAGQPLLEAEERLMLPYLMDESVPLRKRGIVRNGFTEDDGQTNIRALHLSQVLSLKLHSSHLGLVEELCVVGGGSKNELMMQLIADAFQAGTYSIAKADVAAPMGCAISGAVTTLGISYKEAIRRFVQKDPDSFHSPVPENAEPMEALIERYRRLESSC
ncbi:MAG: hypothetical protein GY866_35660 [Proteobacteria bacterium]|nr:hypothetical protein [Pseudomonadota bacterium]